MRFSTRLVASLTLLAPFVAYAQEAGPARPAHIEEDVLGGAPIAGSGAGGVVAAPAAAIPVAGDMTKADAAVPVAKVEPTPLAAVTATGGEGVAGSTTFNDVTVPAMEELTADDFTQETRKGYWLVKFYSPYCKHCQHFAPTWQTIYEFYFTSKPVTGSSKEEDSTISLNSFERYYNFRFGNVNCAAFGDMCDMEQKINRYPTMVLYKDGAELKRFEGGKSMEEMGQFIEQALESIRPGSRPRSGIVYPEEGAHRAPEQRAGVAGAQDEHAGSGTVGATAAAGRSTSTAALSRPTSTPNPAGTSVELDPESFQKLVTMSHEPWFIKFYAPWCHHCQAMAPNWNQMARELQNKLNIGAVNCDAHRRLCQDVHVKAYPTIHFFRGGERVEYDGLRGVGDLTNYAKKAIDIGMGVDYVTADDFKRMEETEEVIFVYFYDQATTSEDFAALDRLTLSLVGHAKLVKTDSAALAERFRIHTWPKLVVSRDERPSYFNALAPRDMRDFRMVLNWMQSVWLPLVPELTGSNAHEIMDGHLVVLGILSRDRPDEFQLNRNEMKNAAKEWMNKETHNFQAERAELRDSKQLRIEEAEERGDKRALRDAKNIRIQVSEEDRRQVRFAWVDGVFWERWLRTTYGIQIQEGERVVIVDQDSRRFWDQTITGEPIRPSRTSILETLQKVSTDSPKIAPKYTTNRVAQLFLELRLLSRRHPWMATLFFIASIFVTAAWGRGRIRRSRGGTGGIRILGDGDGLLGGGGNVNGKSD